MEKNCILCFAPLGAGGVCPQCGFNNAAYRPEAYHLPPGTVLHGRYAVGKVLGEGGFGITYAGHDRLLRRRVAVKEFYPNGAVWRDPAKSLNVNCYSSNNFTETFRIGQERCLQEAQSLASLDDIPAIVRILDFFAENNTAYIIMEFVEGITLREYARRQPQSMTLPAILALLEPVAEALEDVHARGFVHRDVSPDNIMVTSRGKAKLLDFGAVKQVTSNDGTMTQNPIVKRGFSPMELYSTEGRIGPWTDVYALAATIFFLLTGDPPAEPTDRFAHDTTAERLRGILAPPQIDAMLHALALRQENRQRSVAEFVKALTAETNETEATLPVAEEPEEADESRTIPLVPEEQTEANEIRTIPLVPEEKTEANEIRTIPLVPEEKTEAQLSKTIPLPDAEQSVEPAPIVEPAPSPKAGKKRIFIAAAIVLVAVIGIFAAVSQNRGKVSLAEGEKTVAGASPLQNNRDEAVTETLSPTEPVNRTETAATVSRTDLTTVAETTEKLTTAAPTTSPTTKAPTTKTPTTKAPTTKAPTTKAPTTKATTAASKNTSKVFDPQSLTVRRGLSKKITARFTGYDSVTVQHGEGSYGMETSTSRSNGAIVVTVKIRGNAAGSGYVTFILTKNGVDEVYRYPITIT